MQPIKKHCLIVHNDKLNLRLLVSLMRRLNYETIALTAVEDAIQYLSMIQFDLIVTGLNMPEVTGVQFANHVRKMDSYDSVPIVAVTVDADCKQRFDCSIFANVFVLPEQLDMLEQASCDFF